MSDNNFSSGTTSSFQISVDDNVKDFFQQASELIMSSEQNFAEASFQEIPEKSSGSWEQIQNIISF
jgi:hypothetical protein